MSPDLTTYAAFGTLAALWSQIRGFIERIRSLFIVRFTVAGDVGIAVSNYLWRHGRVFEWGDRFITSANTWVRPLERVADVAIERAPTQPLLVWINGRPLMFHCPSSRDNNMPFHTDLVTISSLRGCLDIRALTQAALDFARAQHSTQGNRFHVRRIGGRRHSYGGNLASRSTVGGAADSAPPSSPPGNSGIRQDMRFLHWSWEQLGTPNPDKPFAAMALCPEGESAAADFRRWLSLKPWYTARGIPWRRGHLYYGPPGTGKTSLARALAQEAGIPVFAYDLSTLDNEQFIDAWLRMQEETPCMALIEDIDGCFHGRQNVLSAGEHRDTLTFDCLLNALGGIQTAAGVFIVITTNAPDTLDPALGRPTTVEQASRLPTGSGTPETGNSSTTTRPGRIDRAFCLQLPAPAQRLDILTRICDSVSEETDAAHVAITDGMSAAQVTEYAITHALKATWKD